MLHRELTPADHARIRRQLFLIPIYIWLVFSWTHLLVHIPRIEPVRDFVHFYVQGVVAHERNAAALYDMDAMAAMVPRVVPGAPEAKYPPVYGPQISVLFSPLARLSYLSALRVWLALSLAVYAVCCYTIWRVCPRLHDRRWTVLVLLVAAPALHFDLGFSQVSVLGLVCVTGGFFALRANRPFLAGLAIGSLAYKPPLGLVVAFVFICSREWRIVFGAVAAAAAQLAAGAAYWGPSILGPYVAALLRIPGVANAMEPNKYHMHSWRAFFELLELPGRAALVAYVAVSLLTLVVALRCWRTRGPLVLRYAVLLFATILVDPHLYAYDLLLLVPAFLLLWNWILGEPDRRIGEVVRSLPLDRVKRMSFNRLFEWLLYFCYLSPAFTPLSDLGHIQASVLLAALLIAVIAILLTSNARQPFGEPAPA